MARKKSSSTPSMSTTIGNCEVAIEAKKFDTQSKSDSSKDCYVFTLVNPKDADSRIKSLLQEVLNLYTQQLPAMNYAANTGKESMFLERCVSNGKYCTLLLNSKPVEGSAKVIAAITYQIIPADTQYAEIPLAAVSSMYQHKGIGHLLYAELRKRLQDVGVRSIFCWADNESEGFWVKQGFVAIADVDTKGRARRLPIKADIRKALCFPGGSTLMVSHLNKAVSMDCGELVYACLSKKADEKSSCSDIIKIRSPQAIGDGCDTPMLENKTSDRCEKLPETLGNYGPVTVIRDAILKDSCQNHDFRQTRKDQVPFEGTVCSNTATETRLPESSASVMHCACSDQGAKRKVWEASWSSLKSKKVKGGHLVECTLDCNSNGVSEGDRKYACLTKAHPSSEEDGTSMNCYVDMNSQKCMQLDITLKDQNTEEDLLKDQCYGIMLMNIADDSKKMQLTKIIEALGGAVVSEGSACSHVITGKVRKTQNFCTALCSGYKTELKFAVLRAKSSPCSLLKGYSICFAAHVQPPPRTLATIARSAGGEVIQGFGRVNNPLKIIFLACEEEMEEALSAVKRGIWTFSSDWFMNCVMRQELDLGAPHIINGQ
ncbi:GNAT domain, partial [Dillenia turbinata]